MKKQATLLFGLFFSFSLFAQSGQSLFDNSFVHDIRITFYESNFWDTLSYNYDLIYDFNGLPTGPKIYLPASITIDGVTLDTVGVRQKGFFSNWGAGTDKKPLKVDINEFVSGQKYDGLKKFNLNNCFEDPSLMRDMLSLNLMREAGIPAPRTSYARVFLNNTLWGLYIVIEQVDKTFLKENFSNGNGNLYKSIAATNLSWSGANYLDYTDQMELKTNEVENDWSKFIHFLDVVNNRPAPDSLLSVFNVKDYLKVLSVDVLLLNWDSYYDHGRNFYIYHNPDDGKFHWIPWDYNLAWSGAIMDITFSTGGPLTEKPIINSILAVDSFKTHYFNQFCSALESNFTSTRLFPLIDSIHSVLRPVFAFSPNEFFTVSEHENSLNADIMGSFGGLYRGLKPFIIDRTNVVQTELAQEGHVCPPATGLTALINDNGALLLYPNPAKHQVSLEMEQTTVKDSYEIVIYDALGKKVAHYPGFIKSITLPTDQFTNGLYTIIVQNEARRSTKRLIIRR